MKTDITLLYITFADLSSPESGSSVRPAKMLEAFKRLGIKVLLLDGDQKQQTYRRARISELREMIRQVPPDLCYIEPPSGPILFRSDVRFIRFVKQAGIPISLFYRDVYWQFKNVFEDGDSLKSKVVRLLQKRNLAFFKRNIDLVYVPTLKMAEYLNLPPSVRVDALPPGTFLPEAAQARAKEPLLTGLYIGGLSSLYGVHSLIEAAHNVNREQPVFQLVIVCREPEWEKFRAQKQIESYPEWIRIVHASGDRELSKYYQMADLAICPHETGGYNEITISVKIYEYISYLKPLLVTSTGPMSTLVKQYNIGLVVEADPLHIEQGIRSFLDDPQLLDTFSDNCLHAREENLWLHRARKVISDLTDTRGAK